MFFAYLGGYVVTLFKINLDIVSRGSTIYIYKTVDVDKLVRRHDGSGIKRS